jgi:CPA2 family monovalent cation:H+ antiporter-2
MEFYLPIYEVTALLAILSTLSICFAALGNHLPLIPAAILTGVCLNVDSSNQMLLGDYNLEFKHMFSIVEKFALILMLFAAGLEIDITNFTKTIHTALLIFGLEVIASFICVKIVSSFVSLDSYLLHLYTFVLTLSSTMCAVKAIDSYNNNYNVSAMQILVVQDIALALMLFLLESSQYSTILSFKKLMQELFLYILPLLLVLFAAYATRYSDKSPISNVDYHLVLPVGWCALVASVLHFNCMSCEYGAFVAGLAIGIFFDTKLISPIIDQIAAFFSVGFFISLGLKANIAFITTHSVLIGVVVLTIFSFKTALNALGLRWISKQPNNWYNGLLLSTPSELSFVLLHSASRTIQYEPHINLIESLVIVCIFASSFWFSALINYLKPIQHNTI